MASPQKMAMEGIRATSTSTQFINWISISNSQSGSSNLKCSPRGRTMRPYLSAQVLPKVRYPFMPSVAPETVLVR
jgi:hypothetical protein